MPISVLVVDDDPVQREMIGLLLRRLGYASRAVADGRAALTLLQDEDSFALAILDVSLPGGIDGLELLELIKQRRPAMPVIMLTGNQNLDVAVRAMRLGAYDYMTKPIEIERMQVVLPNAIKTTLLEKELTRLKARESGAFSFDQLIGYDGGLAGLMRTAAKAATTDLPVLLTGETGTGKEVFARAIHGESVRAGKPFVAVNCGAIPSQLVESLLFGHEKGSFTGAIARSAGKFREAEGGTIFLDEIGDLPLDSQVKLLRVLQQKEITPVGADHSVRVNVRVLSATNRTLEADVADGRFREDLLFRLNVLCIHLPTLRERANDIPALARHFVERFAASEARPYKDIAPEAMDMLKRRSWPGNVRELENAIHRAMVMSDSAMLQPGDFSSGPSGAPATAQAVRDSLPPGIADSLGFPRPLAEVERDALQYALLHSAGNVTRAAAALGLAKSTFYRKLKELDNAAQGIAL